MTYEVQDVIDGFNSEIKRLQDWVNDLSSGMYINCVYCGHRYGPKENTPATMADILKQHIEICPKHPLSAAKKEIESLKKEIVSLKNKINSMKRSSLTDGHDFEPDDYYESPSYGQQ